MATDVKKDLAQEIDALAEEIKQKFNTLLGRIFQKRGEALVEIKQERVSQLADMAEERKKIDEELGKVNKMKAEVAAREDALIAQSKTVSIKSQDIEGRESQLTNNLKALTELQKSINDSRSTLKLEMEKMKEMMINANNLSEGKTEAELKAEADTITKSTNEIKDLSEKIHKGKKK